MCSLAWDLPALLLLLLLLPGPGQQQQHCQQHRAAGRV
jgi:hypothetical protein